MNKQQGIDPVQDVKKFQGIQHSKFRVEEKKDRGDIYRKKIMTSFRIVPLDKVYADRIRKTRVDDFGHPVIEQLATGRGPCRVSLRPFEPGRDKRILLTHSPFEMDNPYNQPGPVFISAEEVEAYQDIHRFPPEIKSDKQHFKLTLIGYDERQMMVYSKLVGDRDIDELIPEIFDRHPELSYLHARSAEAGCYICRIERINGDGQAHRPTARTEGYTRCYPLRRMHAFRIQNFPKDKQYPPCP